MCYAYLTDVEDAQDEGMESFKHSRYWGRGWTLQELIAPRILVFFSSGWTRIGNLLELRGVVAQATSIPTELLRFHNISDYSVSQKMSVSDQGFFDFTSFILRNTLFPLSRL